MPLRSPLAALAAAVLLVAASGCDTTDDTSLNVFVVDLNFDNRDYVSSATTATFDARDARVTRGDIDAALRTAGDGALVMLYIDVEQVLDVDGAEGNTTWAALPLTRGFNEPLFGGSGGDPDLGTTLNVSYEYSFDNQDLFFDVVSSLPATSFPNLSEREYFDTILPGRADGTSGTINLRLVTIPKELYFAESRAHGQVDLRDYVSVDAHYNLPD